MDFNDLETKLRRLYAALGARYESEIANHINDSREDFGDGRFIHTTTFGSNNDEQNQNVVMGAVHLIASLKDVIKGKLKEDGKSPQTYEDLINQNLPLGLVTDLDNKDKHGDPLAHSQRSGKNPRIINIGQGLAGKGITDVRFTTDLNTGKTKLDSVQGDVKIITTADIVDAEDNPIMSLEDMLDKSVQAIEEFLASNKL